MYKWLDKTTGIMLRFAYDSMNIFLVFTLLSKALFKDFQITGLYGYTAAILTLSICTNYFLASLDDKKRNKYHYIGLVGIALSLIMGARTSSHYPLIGQVMMGGYFVVVWMNGIKFITEHDNSHFFFKRFFKSALIMLFIMFTIGSNQITWYVQILQPYFIVYFIAVFMNLISMNLKAAYQETVVNVIQVSRRILIFNVMSVVILSLAIAVLVVLFSNVNFGWLETVLRILLMPMLQLGSFFSSRIKSRASKQQETDGDFVSGIADNVDEMREDLREEFAVQTESVWDEYIPWIFIVLMILALIALAYYLTRGIERKRKVNQDLDNDEIRESMITASYLKEHFSDQMKSVTDKIDELLGRNKVELPRLRSMYQNYLDYIMSKGVFLTDDLTPNEVLRKDQRKRKTTIEATELTKVYNAYRYGGKEESELDESMLNSIEEAIENKSI